jgi:hypothetical protein
MQDKVIERLKGELKIEQIEKHKLYQFKTTKVKRLNHLEQMARQMEILNVVDLDKIIKGLMDRDTEVKRIRESNRDADKFIAEIYRAT